MPAKRTHEVVATIGTYKDREGTEKKRYQNCGSAFIDDDGRLSIKLDAVPCSPEWSGWFSLFPIEKKEQGPPAGRYENARAMSEARDDIPF